MLIRIRKSPYSHGVRLEVNGQGVNIPPESQTADIDEELLPALGDSHILYEIVGGPDEAGEAAVGDLGGTPAEPLNEAVVETLHEDEEEEFPESDEDREARIAAQNELFALLDLSVPKIVEKLPGLSDEEVVILFEAEKDGKTRSTLIAAMNERLNPPQE